MVIGVIQILENFNKANKGLAIGVNRGLRIAGLLLQAESQQVVPVDFGVLKASAFTRAKGAGLDTQVAVGYTAAYALYVHELVQMKLKGQPRRAPSKGNYWDPPGRGQAKFLEEPMRRLMPNMKEVIRKEIVKQGVTAI